MYIQSLTWNIQLENNFKNEQKKEGFNKAIIEL